MIRYDESKCGSPVVKRCKDGSGVGLDPVAPEWVSPPAELHAARTPVAIISRATTTIGFRTVNLIMW